VVVLPGAEDSAALGMTIEKRQKAEQTMPLYTVYRWTAISLNRYGSRA
jgi:hypothetical protein